MDTAFWIGLGLAIPLSILANLLTPWFQRRLAVRNERYAEKRREAQEVEAELVTRLRENPTLYVSYLHLGTLKIIFYLAAMVVVSNIPFFVTGAIIGVWQELDLVMFPMAIIAVTALFVLLLNSMRDLRRVASAVSGIPP